MVLPSTTLHVRRLAVPKVSLNVAEVSLHNARQKEKRKKDFGDESIVYVNESHNAKRYVM